MGRYKGGETVGEQKISLAAARVNAKMTQSMVAEKMHVSKQTIVNREKGKIVLNLWAYQELWNRYCSIQNHAMLWICQQTATCQTSYIQQTQTKPNKSIDFLSNTL